MHTRLEPLICLYNNLCILSLNVHRLIPLGAEVVVEELLSGPELSILAFSDGYTIVPLPAAQDHKRIGEGDTGPNTGGMGAYSPAPVATPAITERILKESLQPTINGMRREGKLPVVLCIPKFPEDTDTRLILPI